MPNIPHASWLVIPASFDNAAPGAANAARLISNEKLSKQQRERMQRLVVFNRNSWSPSAGVRIVDKTKSAWLKLPVRRRGKQLSLDESHNAQFELMATTFYAADYAPMGKPEIEESKKRLTNNAINAATLALDILVDVRDAQMKGYWLTYKNRRGNPLLQLLPDDLVDLPKLVELIADYYRAIPNASHPYKPQGPIPPVGRPSNQSAKRLTFLLKIGDVCKKHFGRPLDDVAAMLWNANFPDDPIDGALVKKSRQKFRS
jgi:hypothetical protein